MAEQIHSNIENATGIILRTHPLSETSLIVHWLTPDLGRVAVVAKGARRPNSPFRGKLDLFYLADFSFARSRRSDLHTLREVSVRDTRNAIRRDIALLRLAAYAAALIEQTTEAETPLEAVYQLASEFLDALPQSKPGPRLVFAFELKLLEELGLGPDLAEASLSPGAKEIAKALMGNDFEFGNRLQLTHAQSEELRKFLHGFLIFHLGKIPKSRGSATE